MPTSPSLPSGPSRTALVALLGSALLLAGCTAARNEEAAAPVTVTVTPEVPDLVVDAEWPTAVNDLAKGSLHRDLEIPGENFGLTVDYWVDFDIATWQTSTPKRVNYSVHLDPKSDNVATVLMGGLTTTAALQSLTPGLSGFVQATQTDQPSTLDGYLIDQNYPSEGHFSIDGFAPALVQQWQFLAGDQPLGETALQAAGVYGTTLTFEYSLLVKSKGEAGWHKRSVTDVLNVSVQKVEQPEPAPSSGTADTTTTG